MDLRIELVYLCVAAASEPSDFLPPRKIDECAGCQGPRSESANTFLFFGLEPNQRFTMPSTSRIKLDVLMP